MKFGAYALKLFVVSALGLSGGCDGQTDSSQDSYKHFNYPMIESFKWPGCSDLVDHAVRDASRIGELLLAPGTNVGTFKAVPLLCGSVGRQAFLYAGLYKRSNNGKWRYSILSEYQATAGAVRGPSWHLELESEQLRRKDKRIDSPFAAGIDRLFGIPLIRAGGEYPNRAEARHYQAVLVSADRFIDEVLNNQLARHDLRGQDSIRNRMDSAAKIIAEQGWARIDVKLFLFLYEVSQANKGDQFKADFLLFIYSEEKLPVKSGSAKMGSGNVVTDGGSIEFRFDNGEYRYLDMNQELAGFLALRKQLSQRK